MSEARDRNTSVARERNFITAERTLMAWIRTALRGRAAAHVPGRAMGGLALWSEARGRNRDVKLRGQTVHPSKQMGSRLWGPVLICLSSPAFSSSPGVSLHTDIEYTRVDGARLALDAAIPHGAGPFAAAIIVHGGAWVRGDRQVDVKPLFNPLSEAGFAWFSISYRLMTDVSQFGVAVEDVLAAIRFVKTHAAEFHVDPDRIALIGESAGGQLAAMAALNAGPELRVRAVVALYAPTDLLSLVKNSSYVPQWVQENAREGALAWLISSRLKQLSPIEHVRPDMPPFLLIHGTADPLVPFAQSQAMCERMRAVGAPCELYPVGGAGHGIRWWESSPEMAEGYKREMVRWLEGQLEA